MDGRWCKIRSNFSPLKVCKPNLCSDTNRFHILNAEDMNNSSKNVEGSESKVKASSNIADLQTKRIITRIHSIT